MRTAVALGVLTCAALVAAARAGDDDRSAARVALGRRLFLDPTASRDGRKSCAGCHDPAHGFADSHDASQDDVGRRARRPPSLEDLPPGPLGWDGEFDGVRDAVADHVLAPSKACEAAALRSIARIERARSAGVELDRTMLFERESRMRYGDDVLGDALDLRFASPPVARTSPERRLAEDGRYDSAFAAAFGDAAITEDRLVDALTAYVASLKSTQSAFDRFRAGDETALAADERRGFELFVGKAKCSTCHLVADGAARSALTDGAFHDVGVRPKADRLRRAVVPDGRAGTSFLAADRGAFRTPSLRDVARRAAFLHDGSATTLDEAVRRHGGAANVDLADAEIGDVVAFLRSLTGETRAGCEPLRETPPLKVRVENLDGSPAAGIVVTGRPAGDAIAAGASSLAVSEATTDARGDAVLARPEWTHVLLQAGGAGLGPSRPVPDSAASITLLAVPLDRMALRVRFETKRTSFPEKATIQAVYSSSAQCADATNFSHSLDFVRALGADEALYAGLKPGFVRFGATRIEIGPTAVEREIDAGGGVLETIDLAAGAADERVLDRDSPALRKLRDLLSVKDK